MITGIEALRLVEAYLDRRSKYEDERWQAGDANLEEFDCGWCVYVYSIGPEGGEPPTTCAFVLLVGRDGKVYLPRFTSIDRSLPVR